jgi:uncharacterized membrane protein YkoI
MKKLQTVIIVFFASVAFVCSAQQAKLKRELSHLPPAVQKTIRAQIGDGKLDSIDKDPEDGEMIYDVEMVRDGTERGFTVDAKGKLIDEEVFLSELPAVVQQTIKKQVGNGTLSEIDKSVEDGETSYDVEMTSGGITRSFTSGTQGELFDVEMFLSELPAALQTAIRKQAGTDKLGEIDKCFDEDGVSYDVEVIGDTGSRTLSFEPDGEIFSTEEDVTLSAAPEVVQAQIKSLVGDGKLLGVSKITDDGEVSYDVDLENGDEVKTVSLGLDGKVLPDDESN